MTERAQSADFRRFTPAPGNSSIGGRRKPQIVAENRRKPQIGLRHLRCVTFSSALWFVTDLIVGMEELELHYRCRGGSHFRKKKITRWTFRIFFIFLCSGEGKEESEVPARGGGDNFWTENPRRGVSRAGGEAGRGVGSVFAREFGGGVSKFFFFGAERPTNIRIATISVRMVFVVEQRSWQAAKRSDIKKKNQGPERVQGKGGSN